jgi:hypothetical protein
MSGGHRGAGGLGVGARNINNNGNSNNTGHTPNSTSNSPKSGMGKSKYSNFLKLSIPGKPGLPTAVQVIMVVSVMWGGSVLAH